MKNKSIRPSILIGLFAALTLAVCDSAAWADTTSTAWISTTGDWFINANWDHGVPDANSDAYINNGGRAEIEGPNARAASVTLGLNIADSGTVVVDGENGGTFIIADPYDNVGPIAIGVEGIGTLIIKNGGTVSSGRASLGYTAGQLWTSSGTATVDGAGSTWGIRSKLQVGGTSASGLLSVTNGATVTVDTPPGEGSENISVGDSGTVMGGGTIRTTGIANQMVVYGTLAPTGRLVIDGRLTLTATATTICNVTPTDWDRLDVSRVSSVFGRLVVNMTGTFTPGTSFTLIQGHDGVYGQFLSVSYKYPADQGFTPTIRYYADHIDLYLVPNQ